MYSRRVRCPRCGAIVNLDSDSEKAACEFCNCILYMKSSEEALKPEIGPGRPDSHKTRKKNTHFYLWNILGSLLLGLVIYLILRPQSYISQAIYSVFPCGIGNAANQNGGHILLRLLNNFGPDMLWAYAMTFTVMLILGDGKRKWIQCACICMALETGTELMQKAGLLSGTFDPLDIAVEVIATWSAMSVIILYFYVRRNRYEKNS